MSNDLLRLTEADVRARCTETSFKRGQNYYTSGAITKRLRHSESNLEAYVSGTHDYRVSIWAKAGGEIGTNCNCPFDYGGDCKHIVAVLLAWLHKPESFKPPVDLKAILKKRTKAQLVDLLLDIFAVRPHLVDDLAVVEGQDDQALVEKVDDLFDNMHPWGHLGEDEVEQHLRLIARRADKLAKQGQADLARQIYYAITLGCVNLCRSYGTVDFFSDDIPYTFAVGYNDLAMEQVKLLGVQIKAEIDELYRDVFDPDMLGLNEALTDTWCELIDHGYQEGEVSGS